MNTDLPFAFTLDFNGTRDLRFLPGAQETHVALDVFLAAPELCPVRRCRRRDRSAPTASRAQWRVQDFGRPYPAQWTAAAWTEISWRPRHEASAFGVSLVQPVDIYQQAERAVKYAVLFIVLTFLVFFLWEVFSATLLHPMQYTFVGFAMCVFYLLLVSISEHTGFDTAYALSSGVTTC